MVERTVKKLHERVDNLQEFCAELRTEVVTLKALRDEDREIRREKTGAYRITRKSNDDEGEDT
jgi:mRNA-degrading endonuclease RelE of RelBE toxin-antitoxin system